jgi:hypothetical protein
MEDPTPPDDPLIPPHDRPRWPRWRLAVLGVVLVAFGLLIRAFGCFMVTDSSCGDGAMARALLPLLAGAILIVVAIAGGIPRRR